MDTLTRRDFLALCAAAGAGGVLAVAGCVGETASTTAASTGAAVPAPAPTSTGPTGSTAAAQSPAAAGYAPAPSPTRGVLGPPATGGKTFSGTPLASGEGEFDLNSRRLYSRAFAVQNGPVTGSGAMQRSYLRWTYTMPQNASPTRAAVVVTFTSWSAEADLQPDEEGGATAWALLHVDVSDASGHTATTLVKKQGWASLGLYDLDGQYLDFDSGSFVFQPGVTYNLDVTLSARADVGSCQMYTQYGLQQHTSAGSGTASVSATVTGISLSLVNMEPPWIQTHITTIRSPALDTYDLYERELKALTGKDYYASGALFRVSAGGFYDQSQSGIRIRVPDARIVKVTTPLPVQISESGEEAILTLPPAASLPLAGDSWPMGLAIDPQFTTFADRLDPYLPLFGAPLLMMADVESATRSLNKIPRLADGENGGGSQVALAHLATETAPSAQEIFSFRNLYLALPVSEFEQLTLASDKSMARAAKYLDMPVWVVAPNDGSTVKMDTRGLTVATPSQYDFPGLSTRISTEPWVITSFLTLWQQLWACFYSCQHPLAEWQGLEYPANWNPRFVTLLARVGESSAYWRTWFNGLYYMPPWGGEAIKLADLPESAQEAFENGYRGHRIMIAVAGITVVLCLFMHPRLRRWARRAFTASLMEDIWARVRPKQERSLSLYGWVAQPGGINKREHASGLGYTVVFDFVPSLQPWSLQQPASLSG